MRECRVYYQINLFLGINLFDAHVKCVPCNQDYGINFHVIYFFCARCKYLLICYRKTEKLNKEEIVTLDVTILSVRLNAEG